MRRDKDLSQSMKYYITEPMFREEILTKPSSIGIGSIGFFFYFWYEHQTASLEDK